MAFNTIDKCLIATLQQDVDGDYLLRLEEDLLSSLRRGDYDTLVMDATPLELIDATEFNQLRKTIDMADLMGVSTILVGLKPGVAASLVELEANIDGLCTTLNLEHALQLAGCSESLL